MEEHEKSRVRACSYDPACQDVSPSVTDISMRSYLGFHPVCRDEIVLLALAKRIHFKHATQLFKRSIALSTYLTRLYSTNDKKFWITRQNPKFISDLIPVSGMAHVFIIRPAYYHGKFKWDLGKQASSRSHMNTIIKNYLLSYSWNPMTIGIFGVIQSLTV